MDLMNVLAVASSLLVAADRNRQAADHAVSAEHATVSQDGGGAGSGFGQGNSASPSNGVDNGAVTRGKYLVAIAGCNDCHTKGWSGSNGNLRPSEWLTGNDVGYRGPWGTTYAANLRISVRERNETAWIEMIRSRDGLPPMPWESVHAMNDDDARALYRFIYSLGPKGTATPKAVKANEEPSTAYVMMTPVNPK